MAFAGDVLLRDHPCRPQSLRPAFPGGRGRVSYGMVRRIDVDGGLAVVRGCAAAGLAEGDDRTSSRRGTIIRLRESARKAVR